MAEKASVIERDTIVLSRVTNTGFGNLVDARSAIGIER